MSNLQIEVRLVSDGELRLAKDGNVRSIVGHAAIFNSEAVIGGMFREKLLPGAFKKVLGDDIRALVNHDENLILGRTKAGTLRLSEDERGLRVQVTPGDTSYARDLMVSMERGDVSQMSFRFSLSRGGFSWEDSERDKLPLRVIKEVRSLYEVSVVTFPAYEATEASLRSVTADFEEWRKSQTPPPFVPSIAWHEAAERQKAAERMAR